jgi:hypothetical protein
MKNPDVPLRSAAQIITVVPLLLIAGCGAKLVPVSGTVSVGDQPLSGGKVVFVPDAAKGNTAPVGCSGKISPEGKFEIYTTNLLHGSEGGKGAPPGWYKVMFDNSKKTTNLEGKISSDYFSEDTTPLSIEVATSPTAGAFDFKLTAGTAK